MKMESKKLSAVLILVLGLTLGIQAIAPAASMGTAFTFQGRFTDANSPANGEYDFEWKLFDDPNAGTQLGSTIYSDNLDVNDGDFTAILDFGSGIFDGNACWLEIGARPGDSNDAYTTLDPRRELTPSPYAIYAGNGISGGGTADYIAKFTDSNGITDSNIYESSGKVGIGTSSPEFRFTLDKGASTPDGGILAIGTFGSGTDLTTSGEGTRLIWYPKKAAFRAGGIDWDQWDNAQIGTGSFAAGTNTTASGTGSTAMGNRTYATGGYSFAIGYNSNATNTGAVAQGTATIASGENSIAMGYFSFANGDESIAMGNNTEASGDYSTAMGLGTTASGVASTAMGSNTTASGNYSTAIGRGIEAQGMHSIAIALNDQSSTVVSDPNTMAIMGGEVGIGTTSPTADLHVSGLGDDIFKITDTYNSNELRIGTDGNLLGYLRIRTSQGDGLAITGDNDTAGVFVQASNSYVGIGTDSPNGLLDVNGSIYQRGSELHADYVFEPGYELESIDEHSRFMWQQGHLKAIPKAERNADGQEVIEVGAHRKGIVEELEKAHIYIEQLHKRMKELEERLARLEAGDSNAE